MASGWPGSRPPTTADDVVDVLVSAVDGPGGEAALFERLKDSSARGDPRQLRARHRRRRRSGGAPPRRRTRAADPVHQPGPTRHRRRGRRSSSHPWPSPTRSSCSPAVPRHNALSHAHERGRRQRARPVPLARRSAAGDRARRGADQDAVRRGDHPAPRRPVPRPERPDQPQTGTPPVTQVDHPVELRPAVPRRPARPVGTRHLRRRRTPARRGVRPRSPRRAGGRGDRRGRPAGEPFAGDRRRHGASATTGSGRAAIRFDTGSSTASGRSRSRP